MITEHDLNQAIAECQGVKNPNADTCVKLAAFYTIRDHVREGGEPSPSSSRGYSYASEPPKRKALLDSNTEFADIVNGSNLDDVLHVMDELMSTLQAIHPRLYNSVLDRLI